MYIVDLLRQLTDIGLVRWVEAEAEAYRATIGEFQLRVIKVIGQRERKSFFGKMKLVMGELWMLEITTPERSERIVDDNWEGSRVPCTWQLFWAAKRSAQEEPSSALQGELYAALLNAFGIKP